MRQIEQKAMSKVKDFFHKVNGEWVPTKRYWEKDFGEALNKRKEKILHTSKKAASGG